MNVLEKLSNGVDNMTLGEKLLASLQVTLLGVFIVFIALMMLYFIIRIMDKLVNKPVKAKQQTQAIETQPVVVETIEEDTIDDTELVAVITAAVAASLQTSTHNIVVRNIVRTNDVTPAWGKLGRMQQLNNI
ncbi:OadG family protein [Alkaliphilus peptidifermentans]|uniref:Sodium pump decarboxylases, gamma subunit n=1 Tax=Alkaliphilus peptidifermentans DSM 18978 TaxID=1120976 RepID=A0A1G5KI35_9FIRM|nr:OadG family protein [Alkaliphilus peptidifermentans]SCY99718.1 sodium pump decarboxylases, gamma subunit [Alkaliphilus peptidifermentans DSM 18978]